MKMQCKRFCLAAAAMVMSGALGAQSALATPILMLDFGPTTVSNDSPPAVIDSRLNSPYHKVSGTYYDTGTSSVVTGSFTDTVWNKVEKTDIASGLLYSNNSAATGIALNLGLTDDGSTTVELGTQPGSSSALGSQVSAEVYQGVSVGKDGIFSGASGNAYSIGVQVTGLAAGTYDVYIAARNTNSNALSGYTVYAAGGTGGVDFDYSSYASGSVSFADKNASTASWIQNGNADANYTKLTVTLSGSQALNLAIASSAGSDKRGFLNMVQIVQVPEPGSFALLLFGALGLVRLRRRKAGIRL